MTDSNTLPSSRFNFPQRAAAIEALHRFANDHGIPSVVPDAIERWSGERCISFVGKHPDGREFGIGYEWTEAQLERYCHDR